MKQTACKLLSIVIIITFVGTACQAKQESPIVTLSSIEATGVGEEAQNVTLSSTLSSTASPTLSPTLSPTPSPTPSPAPSPTLSPTPSLQSTPYMMSKVPFSQLQGQPGDLRFSPDGQIAVFDPDSKKGENWNVYLIDVSTGQVTHCLENAVERIMFSPDSQTILTYDHPISDDGLVSRGGNRVLVWNVFTGEIIRSLENQELLGFMSFSPDGQIIITGRDFKEVDVWDAATGQKIFSIQDSWGLIPHSQIVVTCCSDGMAKIWDVATKQVIDSIGVPVRNVRLILSPDKRTFIIAVYDHSGGHVTHVLDSVTGQRINTFEGLPALQWLDHAFNNKIPDFVISPDGQIIPTKSNGKFHLWDIATGHQIGIFEGNSISFSPNGQMIATTQGDTVYLWEITTGQQLASLSLAAIASSCAVSGEDEQICQQVASSGRSGFAPSTTNFVATTFSSDGKMLAISNDVLIAYWGVNPASFVLLWDIATGQLVPFEGRFGGFSPTDPIFVTFYSSDTDHALYVWNTDGQKIDSIQLQNMAYTPTWDCYVNSPQVQFSSDGQRGFISFTESCYESGGGQNIYQPIQPITSTNLLAIPVTTFPRTLTPTSTRTPTLTPTRTSTPTPTPTPIPTRQR